MPSVTTAALSLDQVNFRVDAAGGVNPGAARAKSTWVTVRVPDWFSTSEVGPVDLHPGGDVLGRIHDPVSKSVFVFDQLDLRLAEARRSRDRSSGIDATQWSAAGLELL